MLMRAPDGHRSILFVVSLRRAWSVTARVCGVLVLFLVLPAAAVMLLGRDAWLPLNTWPAINTRPLAGWDRLSEEIAADYNCDIPGWPDSGRYGPVTEENLPWFYEEPFELRRIRRQAGASRLVTAFRITIKDPLFDEAFNVAHGARLLAGSLVAPGEIFSLNTKIGPYTSARGYRLGPAYVNGAVVPSEGGGVCKVAAALYNVAILGDLPVTERHAHSMVVPYVPPGRDAAVTFMGKDLRIVNDKEHALVIWAGMVDQSLFLAVYGQYSPPQVEWQQEILHRQEPPVVRHPNPELAPGKERVIITGYPGVTVHTRIVVTYPDGRWEQRDLGVDSYRPLPRLVEYGPSAH